MKFTVDTEKKTIALVDGANLGELLSVMKKMFPEDWKSFKVERTTETEWITYTIWRIPPRFPVYTGDPVPNYIPSHSVLDLDSSSYSATSATTFSVEA